MKKTLQLISGLFLTILVFDFLGLIAWVFSAQTPIDGFYVGRITTEILKLIL